MVRSRRSRKTGAKVWQYQKGDPPRTVTAVERLDRGRIIEVRWWVGHLKRFQRRSLGFSIRDDRGVIVQELEQEAVRLTQSMYDALMAGRTPQLDTDDDRGPLTLEAGFDLATNVPKGMFVVETEHVREVRRAARDVVWAIGATSGEQPRAWDALSYSTVRDVWLRLAKRYVEEQRGGPAWTERCVVILLQVAQWLAVEEKIDRAVPVRRTWREQMRREWEQITSNRIASRTPRHSEDEIQRIFASLEHPDVDPRIALAVELGAEARLGQVARLMRSQIDLSPIGAFGLGRAAVRGAGKKLGVTRDLTPEERAAIDRALSGYLKHLEDAYQQGLREDYPIFPSGRLKYDVPPSRVPGRNGRNRQQAHPIRRAKPSVSNKPIGKRGLLDQFHDLERIANVTPMPGRGWYGIRRKATDVYEDYETDERVLNDQTGHQSSDTRRAVYQEKERDEIRARSARTRRRVRSAAFRPGPAKGGSAGPEAHPETKEEVARTAASYPTSYPSPADQGNRSGLDSKLKRGYRRNLQKSGRPDLNRRPPEPHSNGPPAYRYAASRLSRLAMEKVSN
jgi:integrase